MTRVTFYILANSMPDGLERFVCRLADRIHASGHRAYVHATDATQSARLDGLMWTFKQNSFVPHVRADERDSDDRRTPIIIGHDEPPDDMDDILVSAGGDVSRFFSRFSRHNEIVTEQTRESGRERYRFYKDRGYELTTHHIEAS